MTTRYGDLKMLIGGHWVDAQDGERFDALNPATSEVIATLPKGTREDAGRAVAAASDNTHKIAGMSAWDRARLCASIADCMEAHKDELALAISIDQGKPLHAEAIAEVAMAIHGFRNAAEQIKWLESSFLPVEDANKRVFTYRRARGVYAIVTPWNFPINIPTEYIAPALATGNAFAWVPAPTTSVCAVKLMECLVEAGVPDGVANLVTGPGPIVGDEIVGHPATNGVCFTGSSATGKKVAQRAASKAQLLELGGNGPTIVLDDANLELASKALAVGAFWNAGQVCSAAERILIDRRVHEELSDRLVAAAAAVQLGNPLDPATTMGPLNNDPVAEKVDRHIADAVEKGAVVLFGGERAPRHGSPLFYQPTVLGSVSTESLMNQDETFGPVAPLMTFTNLDDALEIANDGRYGLVGSVFTRDLSKAFYVAERLRSGLVNINDHSNYWESHIPFGGAAGSESGIGRIGGRFAMMEMTDLRTVAIDVRHNHAS